MIDIIVCCAAVAQPFAPADHRPQFLIGMYLRNMADGCVM
jgi:hypothetical protein